MADFKSRKEKSPMSKTWGFFLVAQDIVLSNRAKFQLIINFFRVKAISTELIPKMSPLQSSPWTSNTKNAAVSKETLNQHGV